MNNAHKTTESNTANRAETSGGTVVRKAISLPKQLAEKAEQRAKDDNRTFSGHIANLLTKDLKGEFEVTHKAVQELTHEADPAAV
jgi:hypothetical protein